MLRYPPGMCRQLLQADFYRQQLPALRQHAFYPSRRRSKVRGGSRTPAKARSATSRARERRSSIESGQRTDADPQSSGAACACTYASRYGRPPLSFRFNFSPDSGVAVRASQQRDYRLKKDMNSSKFRRVSTTESHHKTTIRCSYL